MRFVAIDVETANANMASICSIGAAVHENGALTDEWYSLIDPRDYFDGMNVSIHGIDESHVLGAPTFKEAAGQINKILTDSIVVTHTHFDRVAMNQAASRWAIPPVSCTWLDSARVARRTWAQFARRGYGLANMCNHIGYKFEHHNALSETTCATWAASGRAVSRDGSAGFRSARASRAGSGSGMPPGPSARRATQQSRRR